MQQDEFHPGQRWISDSEPELGLGCIVQVTHRRVTAAFRASNQKREYARNNAPLRRVRFRVGDTVKGRDEKSMTVTAVTERNGLLFYRAGNHEISEADLSDTISFNTPEERLLAGQVDPPKVFELRVEALQQLHRSRKSGVRGFVGGRIELIPHQLYIASEVAGRLAPRVLLADEVGLGKTIEACLIIHRLILTGRAQRVLILVPETLIHQWFIELLRRFNLWFHIFDEERCRAIENINLGQNPFLDDQLIVTTLSLFTQNPVRLEQAMDAEWDVLVVDEAHHLAWSPENASPEYTLVEGLSGKTPGLLLLTATPEQFGMTGHFARLRLLDPDRFYDLTGFIKETERYQEVAREAEQIGDPKQLQTLLDQHGTGRVSFRNTRATVHGFPTRVPRIEALKPDASRHERIDWLIRLLREVEPDKVLLICRTQAKVAAIEVALRERLKNVEAAVFHEGLSLLQRDRNAAWFADERGARLLICSEIGSEGRNFQFAHHLVLFDLPLDPEVLEQRIGRLDRIGQKSEIQVHVPYVLNGGQEVLTRWFHEGLNAFAKNLEGGNEILERFGARVHELTQHFLKSKLQPLIEDTKASHAEIQKRLHEGRDKLLELNSFRREVAEKLVQEIEAQDDDASLDEFILRVFDQQAIQAEELAPRTYRVGSAGVLADSFPGLPADGFTVTADRKRALVREDIQFLTWDHPLVTGAIDLMLGSEKGNSSFGHWPDAKTPGLYLEAVYVLESVAPPQLHVDRFLPPTPLWIIVDQHGKDSRKAVTREALVGTLETDELQELLDESKFREDLLPRMFTGSQDLADREAATIVAAARKEMSARLSEEITRLQELRQVNKSVRQEEIELLLKQQKDLDDHIAAARLRLDAIRLIDAVS